MIFSDQIMKKKTKLAVFDIDGTIFRKNLHFELLDELVYRKIFPRKVRNELVNIYGQWLNHEGTYEKYREKLVSLYEDNIKGCSQGDVFEAARSVAVFNAKRVYIYTKELIDKIKEGYILLVISGSPTEIVKEYAGIFGFDAYYGSVYETDSNGYYTGKVSFEPVRNKGLIVKQYIAERGISLDGSIGIGDTESDASFLELVERPIAFNPNMNLKKIAQEKKWKIVVEKKDVIYEIS
jgi:HAD superfamily hydrolase (TIGR01490 family)